MNIEKYLKSAFIVSMALLLTSCSTPYQSSGYRGGYSETQLTKNVYKVSFHGNGYTGSETAADLSLMRAAEIGLEKGFTHFVIVDNKESVATSTSYTPPNYSCSSVGDFENCHSSGGGSVTSHSPSATNTVAYFKGKPKNVNGIIYEVKFVFESISKKYGIEKPMIKKANDK